jgi:hypothetical protein
MAIASCASDSYTCLDSTEYVGMPAANPQHIFIIREAFDVSRLQTGAGQQEFWLAVKNGDGNEAFLHGGLLPSFAHPDSRGRLSPRDAFNQRLQYAFKR